MVGRQTKNGRDYRSKMRIHMPDKGSNVLGIWCYWLPHLVDRFLDVHRSDYIGHQQPHIRLGERFSWADSSTEPKDGVNLVSGFRIHLS